MGKSRRKVLRSLAAATTSFAAIGGYLETEATEAVLGDCPYDDGTETEVDHDFEQVKGLNSSASPVKSHSNTPGYRGSRTRDYMTETELCE